MVQHAQHRSLVTGTGGGRVRRIALALAFACGAASPALACRQALVLALDVSISVSAAEDSLQRRGLAAALLSPPVAEVIFASPDPVALYVMEWSGKFNQQEILGWTYMRTPGDLAAAAATVAESVRSRANMPTAIGHALGHASRLFDQVPDCLFRTIDVSGDGVNNDGFGPVQAYRAFPFDGITVNGLVIEDPAAPDPELARFYRDQVLYGPGAFLETANGFADYERAIRQKLVRELAVQILGRADALSHPGRP